MKKLSVRSLIPNIFTFISLTLGLTAIKFAIESKWQISVMLVIFASFLDNIDGKLARLLKSDSNFGVELDSLSDFISFGITPAIIVYLWANSFSMETTWSIVVFYAICSSSRLAKFNISNIEKTNKDLRLKFFSGISTPAAAGLSLLPLMINFRFDLDLSSSEIFFKFFLFVPAILMISNIPTYSLKGLKIEKKFIPFAIILFAGFISLLLTDFWLGMILFITFYFLTVPLAIYESRKY